MSDPRLVALMDRKKQDQRSALMKAKGIVAQGGVVNFCPFGCDDTQLDEHGYCKHLIGFTNDKKFYEPMVWDATRQCRVVRVKMTVDEDGKPVPQLEPCQKGDKFVEISVSSRVYRNTEALLALAEAKPAKAK